MDYVMAHIKSRISPNYKKLLSNVTLYQSIDFEGIDKIPYSPDHNLDDDSYFVINDFSKQSFFLPILKSSPVSTDYNNISFSDFADISYIISIQKGGFFFQKITPASYIKRKMIKFGDSAELEEMSERIIVRESADAIYIKDNDCLLFKNLPTISSIFKGIDQLYKEATEGQVADFLSNNFMVLMAGFEACKVSKPNRKRIAMAIETLEKMTQEDKSNILEYIKDYCGEKITFNENDGCFNISCDADLKNVIYGIEQRFYTTICGGERRLANSIVALSKN